MRTNMKWIVAIGIILVLLLSVCTATAEATGTINVSVSIEGKAPATPETYTIRLTADGDFPMPEGADGKTCDLKVSGAKSASFPAISFDQIGIYTYTVKQIAGKAEGVTYDSSVYNVKITVYNGDKGGLSVSVAIRKQGSDKKVPIEFVNTYPDAKTTETVRKVWDDNDNKKGKRPESLKVTLNANGKAVKTVTLNESNGWKAVVSDLPVIENGKRVSYSWKEESVTGYKLSDTKTNTVDGGRETVLTNTEEKPTGGGGAPIPPLEETGIGMFLNIGDCIE